jgi:hypothetical protein
VETKTLMVFCRNGGRAMRGVIAGLTRNPVFPQFPQKSIRLCRYFFGLISTGKK